MSGFPGLGGYLESIDDFEDFGKRSDPLEDHHLARAKWTLEKSDIFRNPQNHQSTPNSPQVPKTRKFRKLSTMKK